MSHVYKASVGVPVFAYWICPYCNKTKYADGSITCSFTDRSENTALQTAKGTGVDIALDIIDNPRDAAKNIRKHLDIGTKCKHCKKKPVWAKGGGWYEKLLIVSIIAVVILLIDAISSNNLYSWIGLAVSMCALLLSGFLIHRFSKTMKSLPDKYLPVFGSENANVLMAAHSRGMTIPTKEEAKRNVMAHHNDHALYEPQLSKAEPDVEPVVNESTVAAVRSANARTPEGDNPQNLFCRKCGRRLMEDSDFCCYCGAKIVP